MKATERLKKSLKRGHICPHRVSGNENISCDMCDVAEVLQFLDWAFNENPQHETGRTKDGFYAQGFIKNEWTRIEAKTRKEALYLLFKKRGGA